jgi:hypothetical protein
MQLDFLVICANLQHADKMDFLTHYHDFQEMLTINYCFQTIKIRSIGCFAVTAWICGDYKTTHRK